MINFEFRGSGRKQGVHLVDDGVRVGDRVGLILEMDDQTVHFLGWGVYEGTELPPDDPAVPIPQWRRLQGATDRKFRLDDGRIVWGSECWAYPEEQVRRILTKRTVAVADLEAKRRQWCEERPTR